MPEKITQKIIEKAPSMRGKFISKNQKLTELERRVAEYQDLLDENGLIKDDALVAPPVALPAGFDPPVPLENLIADTSKIETDIAEVKGGSAKEAIPEEEKQVDEGLAPPGFETGEPDVDPGLPPGSESDSASIKVNVADLIANAKEPVRCGHCGWDQRGLFTPPKFSEEDKMAFIRHIMSSDGRFFKIYDVFGDNLQIILRSRTQAEMELILECGRQDMKAEKLIGMGDLTAQLQRYHIAASVSKIIDRINSENSRNFDALSVYAKSSSNTADAVRAIDEAVFGTGQPTALYNVITAVWMEFERLYAWFTAKAHEVDFWKAAAGDHS